VEPAIAMGWNTHVTGETLREAVDQSVERLASRLSVMLSLWHRRPHPDDEMTRQTRSLVGRNGEIRARPI